MFLYHGSQTGKLKILKPSVSEHGKPLVYFSSNALVALLYAVKPIPKPFNFYPYGFDSQGRVVYSEYYKNAFYDIYHEKKGYLYICSNIPKAEKLPAINYVFTCEESVIPDSVLEISDIYTYFKSEEDKGNFIIKPLEDICLKEISYIHTELNKDIEKYNLRSLPENPYSVFLKKHFKNIWN